MATPAQSIIYEVQTTLQDKTGVRWPASDLVRYLNRAQHDIRNVRPDATAKTESISLVGGFRQTLPAEAASLIDITSNTNGPAITKTDVVQLDAVVRNWRALPQRGTVIHFMHDPAAQPRVFEVFPPALANTAVEMRYSAYPTDVPTPTGDGKAFSTVDGDIALQPEFSSALRSMVLFYAYSVDAQYGGNAALAAGYLQQAASLLGVQFQSNALVAPKQ